jgi:DNA-binding NarL/FixJ family response regulator
MAVRVLMVDDNALFREGVANILAADGRFVVVGQASDGVQGLAAARELRPDVILVDLQMPALNGTETIRRIRAEDSAVAIGILTVFENKDRLRAALNAGANGYLAKDVTPAELCDGTFALAQGRPLAPVDPEPPADGGQPALGQLLTKLTPRELEVLRALATGASNEAIARRMGISPKTLRNHISNTYHKLQIYDRAQAVIVAVQQGLIDVPRKRS